jgi:hypothetical protein
LAFAGLPELGASPWHCHLFNCTSHYKITCLHSTDHEGFVLCAEYTTNTEFHPEISGFHCIVLTPSERNVAKIYEGLISLWLCKENNKLRDLKKCIYSTYSPLSSTHLCLRCSNFFNPSKKCSFGCSANRKIENRKSQSLISTPTYKRVRLAMSVSLSVGLNLILGSFSRIFRFLAVLVKIDDQ